MLNQFAFFNVHAKRFLIASAFLIVLIGAAGWMWNWVWWLYIIVGPVILLGIADMFQKENTIIRNFPVLGHFRYLFLSISPEIRQYFIESNTDGKPFNKNQRDFVNKRSENAFQTHPFGTELNLYEEQYIWAPHSIYPKELKEEAARVTIGNKHCNQYYDASILNISAMSYGSLSAAATRVPNKAGCRNLRWPTLLKTTGF